MNEKDKNEMLEAILNENEAYQCKLWAVIMAGADTYALIGGLSTLTGGAAAALGVLRDQRALLPLRELIMEAEELGELEDTALKSFKKIMAANWQSIPGATAQKKPAATF